MSDTAAPSPASSSAPAVPERVRGFFASRGWRFATLIALTLAMFVPLILISFVIEDRVSYRRAAISEVADTWGGRIGVSGPFIVIPVEVERTRRVDDTKGLPRTETYREQATPIVLRPETLTIVSDARSEIRRRGIFEVPVFAADLKLGFDFDTDRIAPLVGANVRVGLEDNLYLSRGELATNAQLVERATTILAGMNVDVMGPDGVRTLLSLTKHG